MLLKVIQLKDTFFSFSEKLQQKNILNNITNFNFIAKYIFVTLQNITNKLV